MTATRAGGRPTTTAARARPQTAGAGACEFLIGPGGLAQLPAEQAAAWTGLLRAHRRLTRELEAALQARHGLTLSGLEALGRLAGAEKQTMRIARLAEQIDLSVSRTSRILDSLEDRGLAQRRPCPEDSRATNVKLTRAGLRLTREAQQAHLADVKHAFIDRLTSRQVAALAAAFKRLAPPTS
jgi:DNA-binding MarR family transcriptional regulator